MEEKEKKEEEKKEKDRFELVEYPTQTTFLGKDNKTGVLHDDKALLIIILNKLDKIQKAIG